MLFQTPPSVGARRNGPWSVSLALSQIAAICLRPRLPIERYAQESSRILLSDDLFDSRLEQLYRTRIDNNVANDACRRRLPFGRNATQRHDTDHPHE